MPFYGHNISRLQLTTGGRYHSFYQFLSRKISIMNNILTKTNKQRRTKINKQTGKYKTKVIEVPGLTDLDY
jgi:hypothetical protein